MRTLNERFWDTPTFPSYITVYKHFIHIYHFSKFLFNFLSIAK
ncbi:hypothetical protein BACCELL_05088 [Bacteroides cellulosilyticus DSM 14838]|uniref:Uncharacterized protein n=1 Tax=Bacteroides cellulosilyticus DSM 14838 TaxID=537012 RepID=E2NL94_9BACE|nr:hypothetical protein BACCELL_05088 [Bacteroides cellulosilyticus DSM 14838]